MIIDIHSHAYRKHYFHTDNCGDFPIAEELLAIYDRLGVDRGCILPLIGPEHSYPQNNEDILEMAQAHPDRLIPFCNIHPRAFGNSPFTPLEEVLCRYRDAGCKGIGEVTCNMTFSDHFMQNLFRAAEISGLPMTIHLAHRSEFYYGVLDDPGLPGLEETLMRYPKLRILGHSAPIWAEIGPLTTSFDRELYPTGRVTDGGVLPELLRRYDNFYGDLSAGSGANALLRDPEFAVKFLNEFQDKLLFGLDIVSTGFLPEHRKLPDFLKQLRDEKRITPEVYDKVTHINAIKLLEL